MPASALRQRLTRNGRPRPDLATDAPRALRQLGRTQVPDGVHGPAQRGAWVRGWCDGVRLRDVDTNPYLRAGSGWQHGMAGLYRRGWRAGKLCTRIDRESDGLSDREYRRLVELRDRASDVLRAAQTPQTPNP